MWLSDRRTFLIAIAAALSGCGFTPAYGPSGPARKLLGQITVDAPENRDEQLLVQNLETRLGRTLTGRYELGYTLSFIEERMAVSGDNITSRFNIVGSIAYTLRDVATEKVLTSGKVNSFTGYSTTSSTVATLASERDARERLAVILSDQIVTRLIAASVGLPE